MQKFLACLTICGALCVCAQERQLKTRDEVPAKAAAEASGPLFIVPAGTRVPIQLRQPISTKNAQPGDTVYAQTSFPIVVPGGIAIPAGTWVQGTVDHVKRAGRIKGTAELRFHLTSLIYNNGHTVDMAAAIQQVPGANGAPIQEPGTIKQESEKGKDVGRVLDNGSRAAGIGAMAGAAANPTLRGMGVGGLTGVAAGTLIGILARGADVQFDAGASVEIVLTQAIAIEKEKVQAK